MGKQICGKCLNSLITAYIFITNTHYIRSRLIKCLSNILSDLKKIDESKNVIIEIEHNALPPSFADDENKDEIDVDVLEDEFRIESDSEKSVKSEDSTSSEDIYNPARNVTKTYGKRKRVVNGYSESVNYDDMCSEFMFKIRKVSRVCRFTCPICSKHFISDYFLKKHILSHLLNSVNCVVCKKRFVSKFDLFEHVKMSHVLNVSSYRCEICHRRFASRSKLREHDKSHSIKQCHLCDKYFKSQKYFDSHLNRHAVRYRFAKHAGNILCSVCEKSCSNENELSLHVNKVHIRIKPYSCDMCEKQFYTEYNLKCHKKLHSLYSREECEFCHRVFKCRKSLVVHLRKHIDIKPDLCPVCSQSFYSESEVRRHMKLNHGGKFCCRVCKKVVDSNNDLKYHIKIAHSCM